MILALQVSVFSLFHPVELEVRPAQHAVLMIGNETLEGAQSRRLRSGTLVTGRAGAPTDFILSVPGKIEREFHGRLEIRREGSHLLALVQMDVETAVASIVEGESPGAPGEARKAQAVAARSYLEATHGRHSGYDFCDTTHCQYLRGSSRAGALGERAAADTRGLIVAYQGHVVPALYSADCGGHSRSLQEAGWAEADYPFFGVACPIKGKLRGHGIGMCQRGAEELARRGKSFREILSFYFPATTLN